MFLNQQLKSFRATPKRRPSPKLETIPNLKFPVAPFFPDVFTCFLVFLSKIFFGLLELRRQTETDPLQRQTLYRDRPSTETDPLQRQTLYRDRPSTETVPVQRQTLYRDRPSTETDILQRQTINCYWTFLT